MSPRITSNKPPTTIAEQIDLLKSRGLIIDNEDLAAHFLSHLNYYRLRGYWFFFIESSDKFKVDTRFEDIIHLYDFDRHLRLLVLDAIERFEVSLRTQWAYVLGHTAGQSAHREASLFSAAHRSLLVDVEKLYNDRKERYLLRYLDEGEEPPIWVLCEAFSLGDLSKWLSAIKSHEHREQIAQCYAMRETPFCAFVRHLTIVRNLCAHHTRLWDRPLDVNKITVPKTPKVLNEQTQSSHGQIHRIYNTLAVLAWIMKIISPATHWTLNVRNLLASRPDLWSEMGLPENWQTFPLWQGEAQ